MRNLKTWLIEAFNKTCHALIGWLAVDATVVPDGWAISFVMAFYFWRYQFNEEHNLTITENRLDPSFQEFREFLIGASGALLTLLVWSWPK